MVGKPERFQIDMTPARKSLLKEASELGETSGAIVLTDGLELSRLLAERYADKDGIVRVVNPNDPSEVLAFTTPALRTEARNRKAKS